MNSSNFLPGHFVTRREALLRTLGGLGGIALTWLLQQERAWAGQSAAPVYDLLPRAPHFSPQAKSVIFIFMGGGPSHVDLLDPKPMLDKYDGTESPFKVVQRALSGSKKLMASPFKFQPHGQSGIPVSERLPHLSRVVDEIAVIRSATNERIDHDEAQLLFNSGRGVNGFPSLGAWVSYGLGTENQDLPAYIALTEGGEPIIRQRCWTSGWLPPIYQGARMNATGVPMFDLARPESVSASQQRSFLSLLNGLNRIHQAARPDQLELEARIANYELAARMQVRALEQVDLSGETAETKRLYGLETSATREYGLRCLLARRLVERGVRFVHIINGEWDHHSEVKQGLERTCGKTDQPIAGLLTDLKQRGLLDSTLVIWSGEFGRLPTIEGNRGRDHNPFGFSMWMAGGGIKGGTIYGATDDFGYAAVENKVTSSDVHATVLHLLGLGHARLTYDFEGRKESLIGVTPAQVLSEIIT